MTARSRDFLLATKSQEDSRKSLQLYLSMGLVLIGIGNIAIPGSWPLVSSAYLPISLLAVLILMLLNLKQILSSLKAVVLLSLLVISFSLGYFVTPLNPYGETKLVAFAVSLLLLTAPSAFRRPSPNIQLMIKAIVVISVISSILLLLIGKPDVAGRSTLLGINPISTGRVAGIGVLIALVYLFSVRNKSRLSVVALVAVAIPCTIATALTGSRGPLVAVIAGVTVALIAGWKRNSKQSFLILIGFLGIGAYLNTLSFENTDLRIISTDSTGRDVLFEAAFSTLIKNPIGLGWGNFHEVLPGQRGVNSYTLYPHNIFLEVGVEGGWLALIVFTLLVVVAFRNAFRSAQTGSSVSMFLLSMLVFALVNACFSSDLVGNRLMWLFVGLCLLTSNENGEDSNQMNDEDAISKQKDLKKVFKN